MTYDFDHTQDHRHNGSFRWDMPDMPSDVIGMGTADLDYDCAPAVREALLPIAKENCYNYRQRPEAYYEAVIGWYQRRYNLLIKKEWISSVPSTIGAVRMALEVYAKRGDYVIAQTPLFGPIARSIEGADCLLVPNPLKIENGRYVIDFDDFEAKVRQYHPTVYVMVNPHNPTGRVFTRDELEKLVSICSRHQITIVSDEVHGMVVYEGHSFIPLLAVNEEARRIGVQVMSLSKGFNIMSLPHAIITIADEAMQKAWLRQIQAFSFGYATNSFAIAAVTTILQGNADEWLVQLTSYLKQNLDTALAFIKEHKLPLVPYRPDGGFLLWIDCRKAHIGDADLDTFFLDKAHILLDDGMREFGEEGKGFIRVNFAVTHHVLQEALSRMEKALAHTSLDEGDAS